MEKFNVEEKTFMVPYTAEVLQYCNPFCCGDSDLDEYFQKDAFLYEKELLGKSYCWINKANDKEIVALVTLSYDGIKTNTLDNKSRNALQRKIPYSKQHRSYPAVLIGRLGVNKSMQSQGLRIGSQIIQLLKYWFVDENNKAACRYIIVDAYNTASTLRFYENNDFKPLYKNEESEKEAFGVNHAISLNSRILYFDLKRVL